MKIRTLTILFILSVPAVFGQSAWTLDDCMEYAVTNSPKVSTARSQSEIYRVNHRESVAALFPSVSGYTGGQFNFGRNLGEDNTYADINAFSSSYEVNGSLTLFDGLASVYRVKIHKTSKLMGRHELQRVKDEIAFDVMEAFFLVQGYMELTELCREQLRESQANLEQTERMAEVGLKGFPDVAEMKAQAAVAQYNLTKQENLLNITLIRLKEKMNFPIEEPLEIVPYQESAILDAQYGSPTDIYRFAAATNPAVLAVQAREEYSLYNYKTVRGSLFPSIYINGGYNTGFYRNMASGSNYESYWIQLRNKRGHYVGFGMSIPIFGGLSRSSNAKRASLELAIARNESHEALRTLYSEIEQALADVSGQADQYRQAQLQVEAALLSYQLSLRKYNEGLISAVELQTSSNRLLESRAETTTSLLLYHLKRRLLDYYRGVPFYSESNVKSEN
ncbi:MAG: TolC family protein [Alistipes sp.]|nr:TolC family protein [Alistipes sp.]